jgi:glycosyltransferase involved in cell wall biosynthesis
MISLIIRTKNEERWITPCLQAVFGQDVKDIEVIVIDNHSTDKTVEKAKRFPVQVLVVDDYLPGKALNVGFNAAKGEFIVCLSAHCIPVNGQWLSHLLTNFKEKDVAGVYGRQEPMSFSSDFDKRDLLITFGLDRRVQVKDSFFHNANSMIRREVWKKIPFDDQVTNIEDRLWAEKILKAGHKIVYEPLASVYHHHGIHQDRNPERCANVVRILEEHQVNNFDSRNNTIDIEKLNVVALIPVKGESPVVASRPLLEYTIARAKASRYLKKIIVSTDNKKTAELARSLGAEVPFLRDASFSGARVDLEQVLQYSLGELEKRDIWPDIIVSLEITFPFRDQTLIDDLIFDLVDKGLDTVVPAREEFNSCWIEENSSYRRIDEGFTPREFKKPVYVAIKGLGCATYPNFIRDGKLYGNNVGMYTLRNPNAFIEVRSQNDFLLAESLLAEFLTRHDIQIPGSHSSRG